LIASSQRKGGETIQTRDITVFQSSGLSQWRDLFDHARFNSYVEVEQFTDTLRSIWLIGKSEITKWTKPMDSDTWSQHLKVQFSPSIYSFLSVIIYDNCWILDKERYVIKSIDGYTGQLNMEKMVMQTNSYEAWSWHKASRKLCCLKNPKRYSTHKVILQNIKNNSHKSKEQCIPPVKMKNEDNDPMKIKHAFDAMSMSIESIVDPHQKKGKEPSEESESFHHAVLSEESESFHHALLSDDDSIDEEEEDDDDVTSDDDDDNDLQNGIKYPKRRTKSILPHDFHLEWYS
jgi:hypothetical protein